jgi:Ca-activated chloride channel family protein
MRPHDRVTLIGFAEYANMLAEDATAAQLTELIDTDALASAGGNSRLTVGLHAAIDAAQAASGPEARRVVFISPLDEELGSMSAATASEALGKLSEAKIPWQFVRLGAGKPPEPFVKLVEEARGQLTSATSATQIHSSLTRLLTGRDALVASGVTVKLVFNPKAVSGYRLVGHEATTLTGEASDPLEVDLRAGEQLVGLYEMWIKPTSDEVIATIELSWRDAASGQPRKAAHAIRRTQLAESFAGAPHWLQQGIVTAKAAEVLRGSYYAPASRPFGQLRDLAGQVDMQVAQQPSFKQLVELVDLAEKLR